MSINFKEANPEKRFIQYYNECFGDTPNNKILCAVSGGADSMCLLVLMNKLSRDLGIQIACGHYNHSLRGAESDRDEDFVRKFCARNGIEFFRAQGDVLGKSKSSGMSVEEAAREMRYAALEKMADDAGCSLIATAHNADDNSETMLINLARGTGLRGLCGIPRQRGRIIRPLLCLTREEIEGYLKGEDVAFVEDSTNAGDDYGRNRIRHHAVPALLGINSAFVQNATRAAELLRQDEEFLSGIAEDFFRIHYSKGRLPAKELYELREPIFSRVMRKFLGHSISSEHCSSIKELCSVDSKPSAKIDLPGVCVVRDYEYICLQKDAPVIIHRESLSPGDEFMLFEGGPRIKCKIGVKSAHIHKRLNILCFKTERICGNISLRSRLPGDKYRPEGRNCTKSLKSLFMEAKIPRDMRDIVPVFCDEAGIIGVMGFGAHQRAAAHLGDDCTIIEIEDKA